MRSHSHSTKKHITIIRNYTSVPPLCVVMVLPWLVLRQASLMLLSSMGADRYGYNLSIHIGIKCKMFTHEVDETKLRVYSGGGSTLLFSMMGFAILVCEVFSDQLQLRYWGVLLACALVFIFLLPVGVMMATTSSEFQIKLLLEIIIGYLQSGKPIANIAFATYGSTAINTAKYFTMDMKRAYYMKIPPKVIFLIQILGSILACVVSFSVGWWVLHSVKNICYPELLPKGSPWACP
ncbi:unnamed protein product [Musa acuminata subsp. burmannicoides]